MNKEDLLYLIPTKRIKAFDGMAVTADVWELAHEYTRQQQRFHLMLSHRHGILTGLNIIASIPPDTSIYILPGVAVDNWGQTIILSQPLSYDIGTSAEGLIYILLHYAESRPRADKSRGQEGAPMFVHDEFKVSAVTSLPDTPFVEIARVVRSSRTAVLKNAENPLHPDLDEIDLRFRYHAAALPPKVVRIAQNYLGGLTHAQHGEGLNYLAKTLNRESKYRAVVDLDISLENANLSHYTLIYLTAQQRFDLPRLALNNLYNYLKQGGTVLMETCQREQTGEPPAAASFRDMLASFGFTLADAKLGDHLLADPFLFAYPPRGFEPHGGLQMGEGIILSTYDYAGAWAGLQREKPPTREEIRAIFEWGLNIVTHALHRRETYLNRDQRPAATTLSKQLSAFMEQPE